LAEQSATAQASGTVQIEKGTRPAWPYKQKVGDRIWLWNAWRSGAILFPTDGRRNRKFVELWQGNMTPVMVHLARVEV
jgi:hypothetical protein